MDNSNLGLCPPLECEQPKPEPKIPTEKEIRSLCCYVPEKVVTTKCSLVNVESNNMDAYRLLKQTVKCCESYHRIQNNNVLC